MLLNELERHLIDVLLSTTAHSNNNNDEKSLPFELARMHLKFLDNHDEWSQNNQARQMIVNFAITSRQFRLCYNAVREGDKMK